jgi:hypothetical protein
MTNFIILYSLPNITRVMKSRVVRCGVCGMHGRDEKFRQPEGRDHLEDLGIDGG